MANRGYSWNNVRQRSSFRLPKSEHFGRLVTAAVVLAVVVHVVMIFGLKSMHLSFSVVEDMLELQTEPVRVTKMEFRESLPDVQQEEVEQMEEPVAELLDEMEALEEIPEDTEIDMAPEITEPQFDIVMEVPAMKGSELGDLPEPIEGPDFSEELPDIGRTDEIIQPVAMGQLVIDPGEQRAEEFDPDAFNEELNRKGAEGLADQGALDKFSPLSDMTKMSGNVLENAKGMIGSDLLFEFNQSRLRESARNSLLKVALLIDKNPGLNCWIEGHTDLIGADQANGDLSVRRALAVKQWLVQSMHIDPARLIVVGYGEREPLVSTGDRDAQALNRRVVIKMRRGEPEADGSFFTESSLANLGAEPVLVKPSGPPIIPRAEVVEEEVTVIAPTIGRAVPVEELPARGIPVEEPPARGVPVDEPPARGVPVAE